MREIADLHETQPPEASCKSPGTRLHIFVLEPHLAARLHLEAQTWRAAFF